MRWVGEPSAPRHMVAAGDHGIDRPDSRGGLCRGEVGEPLVVEMEHDRHPPVERPDDAGEGELALDVDQIWAAAPDVDRRLDGEPEVGPQRGETGAARIPARWQEPQHPGKEVVGKRRQQPVVDTVVDLAGGAGPFPAGIDSHFVAGCDHAAGNLATPDPYRDCRGRWAGSGAGLVDHGDSERPAGAFPVRSLAVGEIFEALLRPEMFAGLAAGVIAAVACAVAALILRRRPLPVAGLAIAAAFLAVLRPPTPVLIAVGLLAAIGIAGDLRPSLIPLAGALAIGPATLLVFSGDVFEPLWGRIAGVAAISIGGGLAAWSEQRRPSSWAGPILAAGSALGVFIVVPDTERALVLLGAALPVALLGWPLRLARLGTGGVLSFVGVLVWVVLRDGATRDSAIVGGLAALGVLVAEPVAVLLGRLFSGAWSPPVSDWLLVATDAVVVLLAGRLAGTLDSAEDAVLVAGLVLAGAVALLTAAELRRPEPRGSFRSRAPVAPHQTPHSVLEPKATNHSAPEEGGPIAQLDRYPVEQQRVGCTRHRLSAPQRGRLVCRSDHPVGLRRPVAPRIGEVPRLDPEPILISPLERRPPRRSRLVESNGDRGGMGMGANGHQALLGHLPHLVPSQRLGASVSRRGVLRFDRPTGEVEREGEPSLPEKWKGVVETSA